jgi:hypothetical protein
VAAQGLSVADPVAEDSAGVADEIGPRGRTVRLSLMLAAAVLLLCGTLFGSDDMFPFGPFHMYSNYYPPNGVITSTAVVAQTAAGRTRFVTQADTGLARGDIEGELSEFEADPNRLGDLAQAFHSRFPNASPFIDVKLVQKRWQLRDRRVVGQSTVTLVEWHAP